MISPNDTLIILDGSEERRKFIDNVISQTDNKYLDTLIAYNKILLQRNSLFKLAKQSGRLDLGLVEVLNLQLVEVGELIYAKRKEFMKDFIPEFNRYYAFLSEDAEWVSLSYESPLADQDFLTLLQQNLERDRLLERTSQGIHKDDLIFSIHEQLPLKKFGSQGQQKSFVIALKLAQYSYFQQKNGYKPLLLLDDIFDKLDDKRTRKLMKMVSDKDFGQIFLTDTNAERIQFIFDEIQQTVRIFDVQKGDVHV